MDPLRVEVHRLGLGQDRGPLGLRLGQAFEHALDLPGPLRPVVLARLELLLGGDRQLVGVDAEVDRLDLSGGVLRVLVAGQRTRVSASKNPIGSPLRGRANRVREEKKVRGRVIPIADEGVSGCEARLKRSRRGGILVINHPGDVGTQAVPGVVGHPALVLRSPRSARRRRPALPGVSMIPAAVLLASTLPVLKATLVPGGKNRGNLSLSSHASRCCRIAAHASGLTSSPFWRASQSRTISAGGGAPDPESLAPFEVDGRVAAEDLGMGLGVGIAELLHRCGRGADPDPVEHQVRRGVVGVDDHQVDRVAERERRASRRSARSRSPTPGPCPPSSR